MTNTKMTKVDWFEVLKGIVDESNYADKEGVIAFINHEEELLNKKSSKSKITPTRAANEATLNVIKEVLSELDKPATITELLTDDRLKSYTETTKDGDKIVAMTNQKLSSLVKKLVDSGAVVRTEEKKKAYFSIAKDAMES